MSDLIPIEECPRKTLVEVKVVLTDTVRPASPMERLRAQWPHTLVLDFEPDGDLVSGAADLRRLKQAVDPVEICEMFFEYTSGGPADAGYRRVLRDIVEAVRSSEEGADLAAGGVQTSGNSASDLAETGSVGGDGKTDTAAGVMHALYHFPRSS